MKKVFCIFIALVAILVTELSAQARVTNTTSKALTLKAANGNGELMIKAYEKAKISFAPSFGSFAFDLYSYEGSKESYVASFTKNVKNGEFQITMKDLTGEIQENSPAKEKVTPPIVKEVIEQPVNVRTTNLELTNSSNFKFVVLNGPFAGMALAPGQSSTKPVSTPTGLLEMTLKHDVQQENAADSKISHGRAYRQSVYSGIVVEDQKKLEIKNENLTFFEGKTVRTMAMSLIPYKIVFTAGNWKGQALSNRSYTTKAELSEGFNSFSIQYVGTDGLKYQADIEVIVTPRDRPLVFRETDIKNKLRIKQ